MSVTDPTLLVVDDNEDNRYTLTRRLSREGFSNIATATNGREALELLRAKPIDLVLLDIMMPEMDGFEFLEKIRHRPEWPDIPVVVVTSKDLTVEDRNRLNGGVERIIQKTDRDETLREVCGALTKLLKRGRGEKTVGAK